jgi:hypothetical protein
MSKNVINSQLIENVLYNRGETYGSYDDNAETAYKIMDILFRTVGAHDLSPVQRMALISIANKLARIAYNPSIVDSWIDVAGYATLAANHTAKWYEAKPDNNIRPTKGNN